MASGENCAGFRRGDAPHIFFCLDKRKRAAPGTKENRRFVKTPFENDRLLRARSHPAAPDLWRSYYACAAIALLGAGLLKLWELVSASPPLPASLRSRRHLEKADAFEELHPASFDCPRKRLSEGVAQSQFPKCQMRVEKASQMRRNHHSSSKGIAQLDRAKQDSTLRIERVFKKIFFSSTGRGPFSFF